MFVVVVGSDDRKVYGPFETYHSADTYRSITSKHLRNQLSIHFNDPEKFPILLPPDDLFLDSYRNFLSLSGILIHFLLIIAVSALINFSIYLHNH